MFSRDAESSERSAKRRSRRRGLLLHLSQPLTVMSGLLGIARLLVVLGQGFERRLIARVAPQRFLQPIDSQGLLPHPQQQGASFRRALRAYARVVRFIFQERVRAGQNIPVSLKLLARHVGLFFAPLKP